MPISLVALSLVAAALGIGAVLIARQARRARIARFKSREVLPITELCRAHFPNAPPDTVTECLATVSRITGIELGRLRPTDRFDKELKLPQGNFIAGEWDDIEDAVKKKVQPEGKVLTIGDYVELMGASR